MSNDDEIQVVEYPATPPATLQDIADRCGVARVTVWRALHDDRKRMSAETYERIIAMARELQYDVSMQQAARALVNRRTGVRTVNQVVALMFPRQFDLVYFNRLFHAILDELVSRDYGLLSYHSGYQGQPLPLAIRRGDIDGLIVYETLEAFLPTYHRLRADAHFRNRPIVLLMEEAPGCSTVMTDDFAGGYAAAAHLLDLGHRHLLWHDLDHPAHHLRRDGYRQAYRDRGLDPEAGLHAVVWTTQTSDNRATQLALLHAHPEITGILAPFDQEAIAAYHALTEQGKRVPEEISIIGYDDTDPLLDRRGRNLLTSVRLPLADVGHQAVQLMLRRIDGTCPDEQTLVLPVELIVRKTTAPPPHHAS